MACSTLMCTFSNSGRLVKAVLRRSAACKLNFEGVSGAEMGATEFDPGGSRGVVRTVAPLIAACMWERVCRPPARGGLLVDARAPAANEQRRRALFCPTPT